MTKPFNVELAEQLLKDMRGLEAETLRAAIREVKRLHTRIRLLQRTVDSIAAQTTLPQPVPTILDRATMKKRLPRRIRNGKQAQER